MLLRKGSNLACERSPTFHRIIEQNVNYPNLVEKKTHTHTQESSTLLMVLYSISFDLTFTISSFSICVEFTSVSVSFYL